MISRRRFLQTSAAGALVLAGARCGMAGGSESGSGYRGGRAGGRNALHRLSGL